MNAHRIYRHSLLAALLALGTHSAMAVEVSLAGSQEVPPVETAATGTGEINVAADGTVTGSVTTTGVSGTMAHVHSGAEGVNGPPVITLTKEGDTYSVPAGSKLTPEQVTAFNSGGLYVNVHSAANPGGEIRGQLTP